VERSTADPSLFGGAVALPVAAHDESGRYKADRYFATGFVFVPELNVEDLMTDLHDARVDNDYWGELHYHRLRGIDAKYRTARDWAAIVQSAMVEGKVRANVLSVDVQSPKHDHALFRGRHHFAYNRFTRMALESAIPWCFGGESAVQFRVLSDAKSRRPGGDDQEPSGDNFAEYLPRVVARRAAYKRAWPRVSFEPGVVGPVDPGADHHECSPDCELVQVADLVVPAVAAAIRGPSRKAGKQRIAKTAATWVEERRFPPSWDPPPKLDLWRKFGVSVFVPGAANCWPAVPLRIAPDAGDGQESLLL
jgi:hypothetical protein